MLQVQKLFLITYKIHDKKFLTFLFSLLIFFSEAAIPTLTLISGGNLLKGNRVFNIMFVLYLLIDSYCITVAFNSFFCGCHSSYSGLKGSGVLVWLIIGIMAVRYIFLPLLGIVIIKSALRFGLVHSDPLYQFVLLLQYALPPAMNIGKMSLPLSKQEFSKRKLGSS